MGGMREKNPQWQNLESGENHINSILDALRLLSLDWIHPFREIDR